MRNDLTIRNATAADLGAINAIYNHYVEHSTCTYQDVRDTMEDRRQWFAHHGDAHPVIVAELAGEVVGWGALSKFRERSAYGLTVEDSVYVRHDMHRRGIGRALLEELIRRARSAGHHCIVAGISAEQTASIALHAKYGFVEVARLREVGFKFNQWLDVVYMELML
jgi:phosphinothricin acetyltransferase